MEKPPWEWNFFMMMDKYHVHTELPWEEGMQIQVLPGLIHLEGQHLVSAFDLVALPTFFAAQDHPEKAPAQEPVFRKRPAASLEYEEAMAEALEEFPLAAVSMPVKATYQKTKHDWEDSWEWLCEKVGDELDDENLDWLHRELEALAKAWGAELAAASCTDFSVVMLKGKSTKELTGLVCDAERGQCRKQAVQNFCWKYSFKVDRRFNIRKHGGEKATIKVAQAWCSKMQFFYDIYCSSGFADYHFS